MHIRFCRGANALNLVLASSLAGLGGYIVQQAIRIELTTCDRIMAVSLPLARQLTANGFKVLAHNFTWLCIVVGSCLVVAGLMGVLLKTRITPAVMRTACLGYYVAFAALLYISHRVIDIIQAKDLLPGMDRVGIMRLWLSVLWPYLLLLSATVLIHINLRRRRIINLHHGTTDNEPALGDRILEDLRRHGADPRYRKSIFGSVLAHVFVLFVIPWLLAVGCRERYERPDGGGNPVVALLRVTPRRRKKKPKRRPIVNPHNAIVFHLPTLEESDILQNVTMASEAPYTYTKTRPGNTGRGPGKRPGFRHGSRGGVVKFVRLRYAGREWNDGMDRREGADVNFMQYFRKVTRLPTSTLPEAKSPNEIARYERGFAPPFLYMTGDRDIHLSRRDLKILRRYMLEGGMVFADCGSSAWDRAFRAFARQVFPDKHLAPIPDGDPIFRLPFEFRDGAPPLWHHGGKQALGLKHRGRWCMFYFPGDLNDAWKTGASGLDRVQTAQAFELGVNIVYYSFVRYDNANRRYSGH